MGVNFFVGATDMSWDAWSRGLSFDNEMVGKDGVHKTKCDVFRFQLGTNCIEKGSWFMSNSGCIEELSMRCYNRDGQAKNHMKNFVVAVLKVQKREIDSVNAIGSIEVGVTCEEPNVLELDKYAEELPNVFDNISGERLDPELFSAPRKVEIDFMSRLVPQAIKELGDGQGIYFPRKWEDVNKGIAKRSEYRSRLCGKELKRWDPTMP